MTDSTPELPPPAEPARTAEQRMLRELVDVHEAFSAIVNDRMSTRHDDHDMKSGMAMADDPGKSVGRLDVDIDKEKVELATRHRAEARQRLALFAAPITPAAH